MVTKLSIITPCSRPYNLPTIYQSILDLNTDNIEWIVIFDGEIDNRILQYKKNINIILLNKFREGENSYASSLRNEGLKYANGDYIYFLDDDNIIHHKLYKKLLLYKEDDKVLIFNQFSNKFNKRVINFDINNIYPRLIDTAQFIIPKKYQHIQWINNNEENDEYPYLLKIIKEFGPENIKYIDRVYTYRNYLRRFYIH